MIMKKILISLFLFLITAIPCFANFLSDNPNRYQKLDSTPKATVYVDNDSVSVVRYEPPYYIIQVNDFFVQYDQGIIKRCTDRYFYDYKKQSIQRQVLDAYTFNDDGSVREHTGDTTPLMAIPSHTIGWDIANYIFYESYNTFFSNELKQLFANK